MTRQASRHLFFSLKRRSRLVLSGDLSHLTGVCKCPHLIFFGILWNSCTENCQVNQFSTCIRIADAKREKFPLNSPQDIRSPSVIRRSCHVIMDHRRFPVLRSNSMVSTVRARLLKYAFKPNMQLRRGFMRYFMFPGCV